MEHLGHPERHLKYIHITGTNGKGSVTVKTAAILAQAGFKVGVFTSPHIYTFRERIKINGEMISIEEFEKYLTCVANLLGS